MVKIHELAATTQMVFEKVFSLCHISGLQGVWRRNSDNNLIKKTLGWLPLMALKDGIKSYEWNNDQIVNSQ